jgi:hypothetical protein
VSSDFFLDINFYLWDKGAYCEYPTKGRKKLLMKSTPTKTCTYCDRTSRCAKVHKAPQGCFLTTQRSGFSLKIALNGVKEQVLRSRKKFEPFNSPHEGYAVILEELDELWDEVKKGTQDPAAMFSEAKQVAAMAICFMLECT